MPKRSERRKKKRKVRTPGGKGKCTYKEAKKGRNRCAICRRVLHGTPHGKGSAKVRKMSRSEKRPSALFAFVLCNKCRAMAVEEAAKVKLKGKKISDVDIEARKYIKGILPRIEV